MGVEIRKIQRAAAPPITYNRAVFPFLILGVQLIHYQKQGYRLAAWSWQDRKYYLTRGEERRTVRISKGEHERLWDMYNAYFYSGVYSDVFARQMEKFTRGRVAQDQLARYLSGIVA